MLYARSASNSCRGIYASTVTSTGSWAGYPGDNQLAYDDANNIYYVAGVSGVGYTLSKFSSSGALTYVKQAAFGSSISLSANPIVAGGYIYVGGIYGSVGSRSILISKHNISDGSVVWSKRIVPPQSPDDNDLDIAYDYLNDRIYCVTKYAGTSSAYIHTLDTNGSIFANVATIPSITATNYVLCDFIGNLYFASSTTIFKISIGSNGLVSSISPFSFTLSGYTLSSLGVMSIGNYGTTSDALVIGYQAYDAANTRYVPGIVGFDVSSTPTQIGTRLYTGYNGNGTTTPTYTPQGLTWDGSSWYMTLYSPALGTNAKRTTLKIQQSDRVLVIGNRLTSSSTEGLSGYTPKSIDNNLVVGGQAVIWALPTNGSIPGTGIYSINGVSYTYTVSTLNGTATPTVTKTTSTKTPGSGSASLSSITVTVTDGTSSYTRVGL